MGSGPAPGRPGRGDRAMKQLNVLAEASQVVERCLELVEIKYEVEDFLNAHSSKRICRCPSCKNSMRTTADWLREMRTPVLNDAA